MEKHEQAHNDYMNGMKYKEISEKYNVSINTVKSWQRRHGWKRQRGAHKKKIGAPYGNRNSAGHKSSVPIRNSNAVKHGLFVKYLPPETADLVKSIEEKTPIDILWDNICIKYAAILRAQKIMYVYDKDDVTVRRTMKSVEAEAFQYTEAYEKQASFLMAQSRAMGTLNNMIRQYEEMCRSGAADKEQRLRIDKLKAEVDSIKGDNAGSNVVIQDDIPDKDVSK